MIVTQPDEKLVYQIAQELAPDVIRIRFNTGQDWSDHPAIYFKIILSDKASGPDRLAGITRKITERFWEELERSNSDLIPYFRFRSESEQNNLREASWD